MPCLGFTVIILLLLPDLRVGSQNVTTHSSATFNKKMVRVGISAVEQASSSIGWAVCGGAIGMAIDRFRQLGIADDFDFELTVKQTTCNASDAVGDGLDFMTGQKVDIVIAPPCKAGARMMAHMSTIYKKPVFIWGYVTDSDFSDEQKYPWLTSITVNSET
ncbi:hypothetical protein ANCCEY_06521 [Ancylostoma ceylanicum]|uniref:Receptor ligand binding region domain-containing protein n=1 Tax=Ancylostoma ceylanicum TaxID=53326 RepID=A0A0D6LQT5_9BILA|nr:hypothetical protein ANCCEY_06521 [Ancylostoma ceylanicum]